MPLDKLVLIVCCVAAAFGVTVWLGALLLAAVSIPFAWLALIPACFVAYVVFKVVAERVGNAEDDHYDRMDH